ncbi:MAG: hypothetical protein ABR95_07750 [Sphingobacteriales bacterium BACL12 MAG-120813-bin55]|jgi:nucleoid DNA-binding protein|nr:MAG: hypothetical protein ABR94_05900 [Sphingobacteriales bacterium BACL12 MAG-120802-bin5]KRP09578.1 MAG: hypothetical protein ABR95_07750 [Sphingobacteriales bacterium BACL12 MAG-120813-bin55]
MDVKGTVVKHITSLLNAHDCVIVPGLGGFLLQEQSARIHPSAFIFQPPSSKIIFNERLQQQDGLLERSISLEEGISKEQAKAIIDQFVYDLQFIVQKGEIVKLPGVGRLQRNEEAKLQFLPDQTVNYNKQAFGLPTFTRQPIARKEVPETGVLSPVPQDVPEEKERIISTTKHQKFWLPFAAVLLLSLAAIQLWMNADQYGIDFAGWGTESVATGKAYSAMEMTNADMLNIAASRVTDSLPAQEEEAYSLVWGTEPTHWIVAGAFRETENAMGLCSRLQNLNVEAIRLESGSYSMVVVPVYEQEDPVQKRSVFIQHTGIKDAWVMQNRQ